MQTYLETYTDEVVADFVADIEFIAKDDVGQFFQPLHPSSA